MCRMYASVGAPGPTPKELAAFRGLCTSGCGGPHGDGWGIVGYASPRMPRVLGKAVQAASLDKGFEAAAAQAPGHGVVVAHLRKASSGARTLANTHPFVEGPWAFAHNGTIGGGYSEAVAPGRGLNDSRALFARLRERLEHDPVEGLRAAVGEVKERGFPYTSIAVLLTDGCALWAAREVRKDPEYYELRWQIQKARVVVCQEPLLPGPWASLPNGGLAVVRPGGVELARL